MIWSYLDSEMPIYDFGHLQGVNWDQSQNKNSNFGYCKNSTFSKSFKWNLHNYEDYLWPKFQLNLTLFTKVIAPKPPKMGQLDPELKKRSFFWVKSRTTNTQKLKLGIQKV